MEAKTRVGISVEAIPFFDGGLGYFILNAIERLSKAKPTWNFHIVGTSTFPELFQQRRHNLTYSAWDKAILFRVARRLLRFQLTPDQAEGASRRLARIAPTNYLRRHSGSLEAIWKSLGHLDVVWVPHFSITNEFLSAYRNLRGLRSPVVMTIHDVHPASFPDDWSPTSMRLFNEDMTSLARSAHTVITHSQFQKNEIVRSMSLPQDHVRVTPCPPLINPEELLGSFPDESPNKVMDKFNISAPFAFFPGSTGHTHKNHTRLLLAWAALRDRLGSACPQLVCTSKGHLWPAFKALIESLGLEPLVRFTGRITTAELAYLYKACTLVVIPTLYEGGGSGPAAEACVVGTPVVCSRIPSIEEQLMHSNCQAVYFDPLSVSDMASTLAASFSNIAPLQGMALTNQKRILAATEQLWTDWIDFYCEQFLAAAHKRSRTAPQRVV